MCMLYYISALFGNVKCEQNVNASQKQLFCGLDNRDDSFRDDRMGNSLFLVNIFMLSTTIYRKAFDNRGSQSLKKLQSYSEVFNQSAYAFQG